MIEVNTVLDMAAQKRLSKFMLKNAFIKPFFLITYGFIFLMGIAFLALAFTIESEVNFLFYGILLLSITVGFPVLIIITFIITAKSTQKSAKYIQEPQMVYFRFDQDSVYLQSTQNGAIASTSTVPYHQLFKAHEDRNDFFLFISNAMAYVIAKTDFTSGQPQDLRQLLQFKLGSKFISRP